MASRRQLRVDCGRVSGRRCHEDVLKTHGFSLETLPTIGSLLSQVPNLTNLDNFQRLRDKECMRVRSTFGIVCGRCAI